MTASPAGRAWRLVAAGFGAGYAPVAAGTVASAVAVVVGAGLLAVSPWLVALAAVLASAGGFVAVERADVRGDPGWVVIDEFAGQWIALLGLARPSVPGLLAAFVLFRLLDVTKPGPIGWADRQHGSFGIMADDILAGTVAALVLILAGWLWPGLLLRG
ncbi:MAG TPA: phosphatidylglycerophosphatase A [Rhodopila sp.]|nr:phosphatidylglycerophosphatase A [Rhodopila sp.]